MNYAIKILLDKKENIELELMTTDGDDRIPLEDGLIDVCNALNKLNLPDVSDTLIAWEQFKKANWYESEAIDVEKMLMDKFQAIYGR